MQTKVKAPSLDEIWKQDLTVAKVVALPGFHLRVIFADGEVYEVDFQPWIRRGGLAKQLSDFSFFAQAQVGESGDSVFWPNGYDHGADTLRWDGELARRELTRADVPDGVAE